MIYQCLVIVYQPLLIRVQVRLPQALVIPGFLSLNRRLGKQRPQSSSFAGTPTASPTPEPTQVPAADQQHAGLSLLPDVSASQ